MNKPINISVSPLQQVPSTPNPFEGTMASEQALLLVNALQWAKGAAQNQGDFEPLQTLLDNLLPMLRGQIETARDALYACRSLLENGHG
ncbi:hypothetical protein [Paraburkholderia strydomiana]|uniref:hypothetical protein n=1 Tax=Paraburkholderia strydomiana TaxID=1245417 RepID=UPI00285EC40A|nr:hypothetical protein [Paraburkholderia strydomiana]MDR7006066.1 hypothetical protein [Paraburkholderia strydomiana]